jgi:hypothetical protein
MRSTTTLQHRGAEGFLTFPYASFGIPDELYPFSFEGLLRFLNWEFLDLTEHGHIDDRLSFPLRLRS